MAEDGLNWINESGGDFDIAPALRTKFYGAYRLRKIRAGTRTRWNTRDSVKNREPAGINGERTRGDDSSRLDFFPVPFQAKR